MLVIENHSQRVAVAVVYVVAMFLSVLDTTIVTVALPAIGHEFGVPSAGVGVVSIAYLVALTVFIPVSGWLGDRHGGKRIMLGAIGLFTLGSALCGIATSMPELVVFSFVQGIGGAIMLPVGLSLLFRVYPPDERVRVSSLLALFTAIGPAIGPILGGLVTTYATWRLVFLINVPIGLGIVIWGLVRLDAHRQAHPGRLDVPGLALSAVGFGSLMFGISEGPRLGWIAPTVIVSVTVGVLLLIALVVVETRIEHPLIDLRLFRNRQFSAATALYGLGSVAYIGALYQLSLFFQDALGMSALQAGLTSFPSALGVMAGGQLVTRFLYWRIGPRRIIVTGLVVVAVTLALIALVTSQTDPWWIRLDMLGLGLGVAAVFIPSQAISMATVSKADTGRASPIFNAGKQLGSAVGVALLSTIVALGTPAHSTTRLAQPAAYHVGFLAIAIVAAVAIAVALGIRDRDAAATMTPPSRRRSPA